MAVRYRSVVSVISALTVTCWPGLFHRTDTSKTWNRRALSRGDSRGRTSPARGSWSSRLVSAAAGVGLGKVFELGFELFAFVVQFGEPGADPGAVGLGGAVAGVGR